MGNWISYIIILILSYIFTYIFELKENYVLLYMIIIAPILDGLLFIYFRRVLDAKVTCEVDSVEKNNCFLCNVEIENHGWNKAVWSRTFGCGCDGFYDAGCSSGG